MDDLNLLFFQANDLGGKKSNQAEVSKKFDRPHGSQGGHGVSSQNFILATWV